MLLDPASLSARLNHLLGALPRLTDPGTSCLFEVQLIPRTCFPLIPDPEEEAKRRVMERQVSEAQDVMLVRFGYPYVLDTWFFHMTLTRRLSPVAVWPRRRARVRLAPEPAA